MAHFKLIADAGSTSIRWIAIDPSGTARDAVVTPGINAAHCDGERLRRQFAAASSAIGLDCPDGMVSSLHYYGAGCAGQSICDTVAQALDSVFHPDSTEVCTDMLGAARGMLGDSAGIACILGTGSNSCLYNGRAITDNIPPLGFILGDEGSGAALGRRLLNALFKRRLRTEEITRDFFATYGDDCLPGIISEVYRGTAPSRYLASFAPFMLRHIDHAEMRQLVADEFRLFLTRNVTYPDSRSLPVCFTGGIAYSFAPLLREVCDGLGLTAGEITADPVPGLITYHLKQSQPL